MQKITDRIVVIICEELCMTPFGGMATRAQVQEELTKLYAYLELKAHPKISNFLFGCRPYKAGNVDHCLEHALIQMRCRGDSEKEIVEQFKNALLKMDREIFVRQYF